MLASAPVAKGMRGTLGAGTAKLRHAGARMPVMRIRSNVPAARGRVVCSSAAAGAGGAAEDPYKVTACGVFFIRAPTWVSQSKMLEWGRCSASSKARSSSATCLQVSCTHSLVDVSARRCSA